MRRNGIRLAKAHVKNSPADVKQSKTTRRSKKVTGQGVAGRMESEPDGPGDECGERAVNAQLERLEDFLRGLHGFAELVETLETSAMVEFAIFENCDSIAARVRAVAGGVRGQMMAWPDWVDRLQQVAGVLEVRQ